MQPITRRKPRRRRWTPAILLAVVAFTALVVASPAVAKPVSHAAHISGAALATPGMIAVIVIAVFGAASLVLFALLGTRRDGTVTSATVHRPRRVRREHRHSVAA